jgi:hypothetical protein
LLVSAAKYTNAPPAKDARFFLISDQGGAITPTNMAGTKAAAFGYMAAKPGSVSHPLNSAREHDRIREERPGAILSTISGALRRRVAAIAASLIMADFSLPAGAQSTIWDTTLSNTNWYVPVPQLLAYASPATGFNNPLPIGDQTLWSFGAATNGAFTGLSTAQLAIGPLPVTQISTIQGFVTPRGRSPWCSRRPPVGRRPSASARCGSSMA